MSAILDTCNQIKYNSGVHTYTLAGMPFYGVTGAICELLGRNYPKDNINVQLAAIRGSDVHNEVDMFYKTHKKATSAAALFAIEQIEKYQGTVTTEVIVSDLVATASKIDVVIDTLQGVYLADIKTTSKFDREYCSLQLNTYRCLYEYVYNKEVIGMFVISTHDKRCYKILKNDKNIQRILVKNWEKQENAKD